MTPYFIIAAVLLMYVIGVYNSLQTLQTQITASIQEIGNQLKRQASLIPNLEASVKSYMKHEKGIFKMLSDARKATEKADKTGAPADIDKALSSIQSLIPQIQVVVEDNPEIKADATVGKFMDELTDTADKMSYARRTVIDLSQTFNQKLVVFPSNLVAKVFGFKPAKGLETATSGAHLSVSESETKDHKVSLD
ncbi:MAG: LemA family protein [Candidatus Pacebacteria bacterium]|jgi:LemA protein|nr:LemA family protein [Candidatus Paceibacterota bacterium]MBT4651887.1 LemA family protein [Candidatus Paceibacterota bacterium]MBT6755707.1 LemA family protein [Candidatus Paceibacterota bacterium]MBT6921213.1 LemA family protein [Candidatus Paceibacterota bacterium]